VRHAELVLVRSRRSPFAVATTDCCHNSANICLQPQKDFDLFAVRFPMITWPDDRHPFSGVALASCQIGLARPRRAARCRSSAASPPRFSCIDKPQADATACVVSGKAPRGRGNPRTKLSKCTNRRSWMGVHSSFLQNSASIARLMIMRCRPQCSSNTATSSTIYSAGAALPKP